MFPCLCLCIDNVRIVFSGLVLGSLGLSPESNTEAHAKRKSRVILIFADGIQTETRVVDTSLFAHD